LKSKGFSGDPKLPWESLGGARVRGEKVMRESRVLRGKRHLIYLGNPRVGYVRARGQTCPVSRICPDQRSDMTGPN
jgi:hypothetical protein